MRFTETPIGGAFVIDIDARQDERGFFARTYCAHEFEKLGLDQRIAQCSVSFNARRGTLRGLHYQKAPYEETKVIRCSRGSVYDVIVDLRPNSPTFGHSFATELSATNHRMLYVPRGIAHGFQTLEDETELYYQMSEFYHPESEGAVRWNDPAFGIEWPLDVLVISERDQLIPDFRLPTPA